MSLSAATSSAWRALERRRPGETNVRIFSAEGLPPGRHREGRLRVARSAPGGRAVLAPPPGALLTGQAWSSMCAACGGLRWMEPNGSACWDCGTVTGSGAVATGGGPVGRADRECEPPLSPRERFGARRSLDERRDPDERSGLR